MMVVMISCIATEGTKLKVSQGALLQCASASYGAIRDPKHMPHFALGTLNGTKGEGGGGATSTLH